MEIFSKRFTSMSGLPSVDVCVLVKNEAESIGKCLDSLLANDYPSFRILICDGGSTDGTLKIIQEYAKKHDNIIVHVQRSRGCGAARQELMELVKADYVAWTDGGSILDKNWLRELVTPLLNSDEKVAGSGGYNYIISNNSVLAQCIGLSPLGVHPTEIAPGIAESLSGNNVCFKTKVLRQNPGATFLLYGDDYEMCLRLRQKGYKLIVAPEARAYVRTQEKFRNFHNWIKRRVEGEVTLCANLSYAPIKLEEFVSITRKTLLKRVAALGLLITLLVLLVLTPYKIPLAIMLVLSAMLYLTYLFKRRFKRHQLGEKVFKRTYLLFPLIDFLYIFLYSFYVWRYSKSFTVKSGESDF
jgi:cellulose synthase/poly-beta-1,6-N-acetylglucosamine synthase-like glycosyltransferase